MNTLKTDLCIIGGGAGGLSVAAAAVQMGASVVLLEHHQMGGDCLHYGCVPSKALLAAAKRADQMRHADLFGLPAHDTPIDAAKVNAHVKSVIAAIAHHDSEERFTKLGVTVIRASGQFLGKHEIKAGDTRIKAKRFVIATGSSPAIPTISGLKDIPYLTNETIFDLKEQPQHLLIIGGGPIGCEMAQAHRFLGSQVTILEAFKILPKDNPELADKLKENLIKQGITILENIDIQSATYQQNHINITYQHNGIAKTATGSHCLVATGRKANIDTLQLDKARIKTHKKGIVTNQKLQTSNKRVYAMGDVVGPYQFTHMASYHAGIIIRNVLFHMRAKVNDKAVPWVTYTSLELAHVGISESQAIKHNKQLKILKLSFTENDRAQANHQTEGLIKVFVTTKGKILGATILGPSAGELISTWTLAINQNLKIGDIAKCIYPYPTLSEINKRVASSFYTEKLFSNPVKRIVRWLNWLLP